MPSLSVRLLSVNSFHIAAFSFETTGPIYRHNKICLDGFDKHHNANKIDFLGGGQFKQSVPGRYDFIEMSTFQNYSLTFNPIWPPLLKKSWNGPNFNILRKKWVIFNQILLHSTEKITMLIFFLLKLTCRFETRWAIAFLVVTLNSDWQHLI